MMPSELTSVSPCSTALSVCVLDTLNAGIANPAALAVLSISAYRSGVATGMAAPLRSRGYGLSLTMVSGGGWWCFWERGGVGLGLKWGGGGGGGGEGGGGGGGGGGVSHDGWGVSYDGWEWPLVVVGWGGI